MQLTKSPLQYSDRAEECSVSAASRVDEVFGKAERYAASNWRTLADEADRNSVHCEFPTSGDIPQMKPHFH